MGSTDSAAVRTWAGLVIVAGLLAGCSSAHVSEGATPSAPSGAATTLTTTTTIASVRIAAPVPSLALSGTPAERAGQVLDAFDGDGDHRSGAVLAAFTAAHLPISDAGYASLTTPEPDLVGFGWDTVWASTQAPTDDTRTSLLDVVSLMHLVNATASYDATAAARDYLSFLREALSSGVDEGPGFVAALVAEDARRNGGVDIADPALDPSTVVLHAQTATLVVATALQALVEAVTTGVLTDEGPGGANAAADASTTTPIGTTAAGPARVTHSGAPTGNEFTTADCADDGAGGWVLWVASKVTGGISVPGLPLSWNGAWNALVDLGVSRGRVAAETAGALSGATKFAGGAAALLNVVLFIAQVSGFTATASLDGDRPLVRTKTTTHGEARSVTISVSYETDVPPEQVLVRNCILALLTVAGNNAQQAVGPAANVEVEVEGGTGFANSLAPGDSIVLFGPASFLPVETADSQGRRVVPVQGRAQRHQRPPSARAVSKEFSILVHAGLDPVTVSTVSRVLADSLLCSGVALGGGTGDVLAECNNALFDIIKQFHWDLGEFTFPVTDWADTGWVVQGMVGPFGIAGSHCDVDPDPWLLTISGNAEGLGYHSDLTVVIDPVTGAGTYTQVGELIAAGITIPQTGDGTVQFTVNADGTAQLVFMANGAAIATPIGSFSGLFSGGATIPVTPMEGDEPCEGYPTGS